MEIYSSGVASMISQQMRNVTFVSDAGRNAGEPENSTTIYFGNGQRFRVTVEEIAGE